MDVKLNRFVFAWECSKRLIIKHFGHTFDREKARKLKIIFACRNLRLKILKSEKFPDQKLQKQKIFR